MSEEEEFLAYCNHEILGFERMTLDSQWLSEKFKKEELELVSKEYLSRIERIEFTMGLYKKVSDSAWPKAELIESFEDERKKYVHFQSILRQVSDEEILELWDFSREALVYTEAIIRKSFFAPVKKMLASQLTTRVQTLGPLIFNRIDRNEWNNEITDTYCKKPSYIASIERLNSINN